MFVADIGVARDWMHKGRRVEADFQRVSGEKVYLRQRNRTIVVRLSDPQRGRPAVHRGAKGSRVVEPSG